MKKILKWSAIALIALIGLTVLAGGLLYSNGLEKLNRSYRNIAVEQIKVSSDAAAVARGKHIAIIWRCTRCHGSNLGGTLLTNDPIDGYVPLLGTIPATNLTSGKGGIATSYTDADWVRAIRHGVKPNGRGEVLMDDYATMSDRDLGDLLAYVKQIPPVDSDRSETSYGPILPVAVALGVFAPAAEGVDHHAPPPASPAPGATKEYGKYLAPLCTACHGRNFGGAVAKWTRDDFVRALHSGALPNGSKFGQTMSSETFREMNEMELTALWLYVQNLTPTQAQR